MHARILRAALPIALSAAVVTSLLSCSSETSEPTAANIDLNALDSGNYPTTPADPGTADTPQDAAVREASRLAEHVLLPTDFGPNQAYRYGNVANDPVLTPKNVHHRFKDFAALAPGFVAGWGTAAAGRRAQQGMSTLETSLAVLRFDSDAHAKDAVEKLAKSDFDSSPDRAPLTVPNRADAKAFWKPSQELAAVVVWAAHGSFVVRMTLSDSLTLPVNTATLLATADTALGKQFAALDAFQPTAITELTGQARDRDGVLSRAIPPDTAKVTEFSRTPAILGAKGALHSVYPVAATKSAFEATGVDVVGIADTTVIRTRDGAAAADLRHRLADAVATYNDDLPSPPGLSDVATCMKAKTNPPPNNFTLPAFRCLVTYGRYVGDVVASQEHDVHQKAAAQYKVLAAAGN